MVVRSQDLEEHGEEGLREPQARQTERHRVSERAADEKDD
jgi:hypothetical protein